LISFERVICQRENRVLNSLIYLELVERFWNRRKVIKFWSCGDSMSSRVEDKFKTICLSCRQIVLKRVTIVHYRVNERSNNSAGSCLINDIGPITNIVKAF